MTPLFAEDEPPVGTLQVVPSRTVDAGQSPSHASKVAADTDTINARASRDAFRSA